MLTLITKITQGALVLSDGISRVCCGQTLASVQPFAIDEFITDGFPSVVHVHLIIIYFLC